MSSDDKTDEKKTKAVTKAPVNPLKAGAPIAALIPTNIEEAWRLAQAISISGLAPTGMGKAEQVMVAIMGGAELGLPPFQALQSFAVVNGRPTMWGDGLLAVVRARGVKVKEWYEGEGESLTAKCQVIRPDNGEVIERYFSTDDAKTAKLWGKKGASGGDTPWITYPRRMLQMRARSWAIRDGCADMLRGIQIREEVTDYDAVVSSVGQLPAVAQALALDTSVEDAEIVIEDDVTPEPTPEEAAEIEALTEEAQPEPVEVKPQLTALDPAAKWATMMREAFAATKTYDDLAALSARWNSPACAKSLAHAKKFNPPLAKAVTDEYEEVCLRIGE